MTAPVAKTTPLSLTFFEVTGAWVSVSEPALSSNNSGPNVENIEGLVNFTPRLPRGAMFFLHDYLVSPERNTLQQIFLIGNPTTGNWQIAHEGVRSTNLPFSASTAQVQSALEHMPSIGAGNVRVTTGASADSFDVEFIHALAKTPVSPLTAYSFLYNSSGDNAPISVTVSYQGSPLVVSDTTVVLPAITGRIRNGILCAIDSIDSPGVDLCSNIPELNNRDVLIYDVSFDKVSYNGKAQAIAPFAFVAPTDSTPVCITSPSLQKIPWQSPLGSTWSPATTAAQSSNWRLRAV